MADAHSVTLDLAESLQTTRRELWSLLCSEAVFTESVDMLTRLLPDDADAVRQCLSGDAEAVADVLFEFDVDGVLASQLVQHLAEQPKHAAVHRRCAVCQRRMLAFKHRIVLANERLVKSLVQRYSKGQQIPFEDLVQEGMIGLMKAVDRFDHRRGYKFSTYAAWWVRHAISRAVANKGPLVRLPVGVSNSVHNMRRAQRATELDDDSLASATGLSPAKVRRLRPYVNAAVHSLDSPLTPDGTPLQLDDSNGIDEEDIVQAMDEQSNYDAVRRLIGRLEPIDIDILQRRFGLNGRPSETLREIGARLGISRERVRQREQLALYRLRAVMQLAQ